MQSFRLLGRLAPKAPLRTLTSRSYSIMSRSYLRPSVQAIKKPSYPAFSTSIASRESAGKDDQLLAAKLAHEREVELESLDPSQPVPEVEAFKQNSDWEIIDRQGTHELSLKKTFGNETITVQASITDVTDAAEDEWDPSMDDGALEDEDYQQPKRTINQSGTKGGPIDTVAEDSIAPADHEGSYDDDASSPPYPVHLIVSITKPGNQAIEVRAVAQDGAIQLEGVEYKPAETKEDDETTAYEGPPFVNLDSDLQLLFAQYLEERGINAELAQIMPTLLDSKEQREYVDWLQDIKNFVEA